MAVAEVVPPALLVDRDAEPREAADAVGLPRGDLRQRQLVVGRRLAEPAAQPVRDPQQHAAERRRGGDLALLARLAGVLERAALGTDRDRVADLDA